APALGSLAVIRALALPAPALAIPAPALALLRSISSPHVAHLGGGAVLPGDGPGRERPDVRRRAQARGPSPAPRRRRPRTRVRAGCHVGVPVRRAVPAAAAAVFRAGADDGRRRHPVPDRAADGVPVG